MFAASMLHVEQSLCRHGWRQGAYRDVLAASLRNMQHAGSRG